ncbi:MAG: penicillin-binding protein activator [Burkholderiales bacterium]|nr:penicillin-binding protein activator [Burkholderiales bacterium]
MGAPEGGNRSTHAQEQSADSSTSPHIAVLLPTKSGPFTRAADAVRRGIWEAQRVQNEPALPLVLYPTSDDPDDVARSYRHAVDRQAQFVIGPLTRSAVSTLAGSALISVPTLALNGPEVDTALPDDLFVFGLQIEHEAKRIAGVAHDQGHKRAMIVVGLSGAGSRRLAQSFAQEWSGRGGEVVHQEAINADPAVLGKLRDVLSTNMPDIVFLALEAPLGRLARAYLGQSASIYATSLVNAGDDALARRDLNGVMFVDMPWLLLPDHPAVLSYVRPDASLLSMELQRFYALGIDAYRIAMDLIHAGEGMSAIDGVTGHISLDHERRLVREPVVAQFIQGETRVFDAR